MARSMEREFKEESHPLRGALRDAKIETWPLGYFRWIVRAGKPEFVGISKVEKNEHELKANPDEVDQPRWLTTYPANDTGTLRESIGRMLDLGPKLSVPLWANLLCLSEVAEQDAAFISFLLAPT